LSVRQTTERRGVMKEYTIKQISGWLHEWLYTINTIENKAIEDAIWHIDDEFAGLDAFVRSKPNDQVEFQEGSGAE